MVSKNEQADQEMQKLLRRAYEVRGFMESDGDFSLSFRGQAMIRKMGNIIEDLTFVREEIWVKAVDEGDMGWIVREEEEAQE